MVAAAAGRSQVPGSKAVTAGTLPPLAATQRVVTAVKVETQSPKVTLATAVKAETPKAPKR